MDAFIWLFFRAAGLAAVPSAQLENSGPQPGRTQVLVGSAWRPPPCGFQAANTASLRAGSGTAGHLSPGASGGPASAAGFSQAAESSAAKRVALARAAGLSPPLGSGPAVRLFLAL